MVSLILLTLLPHAVTAFRCHFIVRNCKILFLPLHAGLLTMLNLCTSFNVQHYFCKARICRQGITGVTVKIKSIKDKVLLKVLVVCTQHFFRLVFVHFRICDWATDM